MERDKIQIFISPPFEVCEGWLYGEKSGRRGLVPACYVKKASAEAEVAGVAMDPFALPTTASDDPHTNITEVASTNPFPAFTGPEQQPNSLYVFLFPSF